MAAAGVSYSVLLKAMDAMLIGAAFVGSIAAALVLQRAVLGAMLRAFGRNKGDGH